MKIKKIMCLMMTTMMAFLSVSSMAATGPSIEYIGDVSGDKSTASILEGGRVNVALKVSEGYALGTPKPLIIRTQGVDTGEDISKKVGIEHTGGEKTAIVASQQEAVGTYAIRGNFFTKVPEGSAREQWEEWGTPPGLDYDRSLEGIKILNKTNLNLIEESKISIIVTSGEEAPLEDLEEDGDPIPGSMNTEGNSINFEVISHDDAGAKPTGSFKGVELGEQATGTTRIEENGQKIIDLKIGAGTDIIDLEIHTKQTHNEKVKVDSVDGKPIVTPTHNKSNHIVTGTRYDIVFRPVRTNELLLQVYTRKEAADAIASSIEKTATKDFIFLEDTDDFNWITQDYKLKSQHPIYGEKANIVWEWKPYPPLGADVAETETTQTPGVSQGQAEAAVKEIEQGNPGSKAIAYISPQEKDVKGEMWATTTIKWPDGFVEDDSKGASFQKPISIAKVPITIKAEGKPAQVRLEEKFIGKDSVVAITTDENKLFNVAYFPNIMDVYRGDISYPDGYIPSKKGIFDLFKPTPKAGGIINKPEYPHTVTVTAMTGQNIAEATHMVVTELGVDAGKGVLEMYKGSDAVTTPYGQEIERPEAGNPGQIPLRFEAMAKGTIKLKFEFFGLDKDENVQLFETYTTRNITIRDSTPNQDSSLRELNLSSPDIKDYDNGEIEYGFDKDKTVYEIKIPNKVNEFTFIPKLNNEKAQQDILVRYGDKDYFSSPNTSVSDGKPVTFTIKSEHRDKTGLMGEILFEVEAEDPNSTTIYSLQIIKEPMSINANLADLGFYVDDESEENKLDPVFNKDTLEYEVSVPFSIKQLFVVAEPENRFADISYTPELVDKIKEEKFFGGLFGKEAEKEWTIEIPRPDEDDNELVQKITVEAEAYSDVEGSEGNVDAYTKDYKVTIKRDKPSTDATMSNLEIFDKNDEVVEYKPAFDPTRKEYEVNIPNTTKELKIKIDPTFEFVHEMFIQLPDGTKEEIVANEVSDKIPIEVVDSGMNPYILEIHIIPESENEEDIVIYTLNVYRQVPSDESAIRTLEIFDQNEAAHPIEFFDSIYMYEIEAPYNLESVAFKVTPKFELSSVKVNGRKVVNGEMSQQIPLKENPEKTVIEVEVFAENQLKSTTYTFVFKRAAPSSDALLKKLEAQGLEVFEPIFIPTQFEYTGTTEKEANEVIITPTAMNPDSSITINGKKVASGAASEPIEVLYIENEIEIIVTAQDGKATETYKIDVTNQNKIETNSNADLKSMSLREGKLTPEFAPSVTSYDFHVKEDTSSVTIEAETDDPFAKMEVVKGSKKIGDENGNYSEAISIGENLFQILVTASDGKAKKEYTIRVHRGNEENLGIFKPTTAEDVDFESSDSITIDVSKYPIIAADVFNTLREYPDKTLTLLGNDYSLKFKGSDITTVIPHTQTFDFSMRFNPPKEILEDIEKLVNANPANENLYITYVYFNHHGTLPGEALLTLSLGSEYKNDVAYWHYHNEERNRIDYYGNAQANSQGTFAVMIDHFSTYPVAHRRIAGSEDKSQIISGNQSGNLSDNVNPGNPSTGKE